MEEGLDKQKQARALYTALRTQKLKGRSDWWGSFEVQMTDCNDGVQLCCVRCHAKLGASNPSRTAKEHLNSRACTSAYAVVMSANTAAAAPLDSDEDISTSKRARPAGDIRNFSPTVDQVTKATNSVARYFYKSGSALQNIEHEDLVDAFATLGVSLPSRKMLSTRMLDAEYNRLADRILAELALWPLIQISSDGWRRNACDDGVPLINVIALRPKGGSYYIKAEAARGVVKNAEWIAEQHMRWAMELAAGVLERILGVVMDNTKVNTSVVM